MELGDFLLADLQDVSAAEGWPYPALDSVAVERVGCGLPFGLDVVP